MKIRVGFTNQGIENIGGDIMQWKLPYTWVTYRKTLVLFTQKKILENKEVQTGYYSFSRFFKMQNYYFQHCDTLPSIRKL